MPKSGPGKELKIDCFGELKIGDLIVPCAVLTNEERVIFQREFVGILTGNKKSGLERYLHAKNLEPYLPERLRVKLGTKEFYGLSTEII